jgi:hypothetical protein
LVCAKNFNGTSKAMEKEAALNIWNRSLDKNLRYTQMLSDGDSVAFKAVCDLQPYGNDVFIEKLECVNHCHKRMGTALRKAQKEKKLGGKGHGRLTEEKCTRLQNYYKYAIVNNIDNSDNMLYGQPCGIVSPLMIPPYTTYVQPARTHGVFICRLKPKEKSLYRI